MKRQALCYQFARMISLLICLFVSHTIYAKAIIKITTEDKTSYVSIKGKTSIEFTIRNNSEAPLSISTISAVSDDPSHLRGYISSHTCTQPLNPFEECQATATVKSQGTLGNTAFEINVCAMDGALCSGMKTKVIVSNNLHQYLLNLHYNPKFSKFQSTDWRAPTRYESRTMITLIHHLVDGEYDKAAIVADKIGFVLEPYPVKKGNIELTYFLLREKTPYPENGNRAAGTYVFNPNAKHNLVIEVPHPLFDTNTPIIGTNLFFKADAKWYVVSGTHRQGFNSNQVCDGNTTLGSPADAAHNIKHFFFTVHYALSTYDQSLSFIQIHGFSDDNLSVPRTTCYTTNQIPLSDARLLMISNGGVPTILRSNRSTPKSRWRLIDFLYDAFSPVLTSNIKACFYDRFIATNNRCDSWPNGLCPYANYLGADEVLTRISNDPNQYGPRTLDDFWYSDICTKGRARINSHRMLHVEATFTIRNSAALRQTEVQRLAESINEFYDNKS